MTTRGKRRSAAASVTGTYVVCLDCGKEFPYDWKSMKMVRTKDVRQDTAAPVVAGPKAA
jgi:predicted transcriptional regulator